MFKDKLKTPIVVLTALTLSESDVYRRQILTYEVDPLAERIRYL